MGNLQMGLTPYDSSITSGKRSQTGYSLNVFECAICGHAFKTKDKVSIHVESCINSNNHNLGVNNSNGVVDGESNESRSELEACVGTFLSRKPKEGSVDVVLRLLRNVVREPENEKFRRIRMSNPKITESVGEVAGGVELLEFVGFGLREDGRELLAIMDVSDKERIALISRVIELLEPTKVEDPKKVENLKDEVPAETEVTVEPKPIDRQIQVFFAVPESVASRIELSDSLYNLSIGERKEAEMRKKKLMNCSY